MNLLHLKYAAEIARLLSFSKAAELLNVSQPSLSRSIKELEESLGITIFRRTPKGISPTPEGEEFLVYARRILAQVESVERRYARDNRVSGRFALSAPRSLCIASAFSAFSSKLEVSGETELTLRECGAERTISDVTSGESRLGIIRYRSIYDRYFRDMLEEKELRAELLGEAKQELLLSSQHPLTLQSTVTLTQLSPYQELIYDDAFVPSLPPATVLKDERTPGVSRRIYVSDRAGSYQLLNELPDSFMWHMPERPIPANLTCLECSDAERLCRDVLICKKDYKFSSLDNMFFDELIKVRSKSVSQITE